MAGNRQEKVGEEGLPLQYLMMMVSPGTAWHVPLILCHIHTGIGMLNPYAANRIALNQHTTMKDWLVGHGTSHGQHKTRSVKYPRNPYMLLNTIIACILLLSFRVFSGGNLW